MILVSPGIGSILELKSVLAGQFYRYIPVFNRIAVYSGFDLVSCTAAIFLFTITL